MGNVKKGSDLGPDDGESLRRISKNYGLVEESPHAWTELYAPLILLAIGLVVLIGSAIAIGGGVGIYWAAWTVGAILLIQLPITIVGMYVLGAVLGISYGLLKSAVLKMAAIMVVVTAISFGGLAMGYPSIARLTLSPLASWTLFSTLFDLDVRETVASAIGLWLLGIALSALVAVVLGA